MSSGLTVTGCIFNGNSASTKGGGMFISNSNQTIMNCTFSGNTGSEGGAIHMFI